MSDETWILDLDLNIAHLVREPHVVENVTEFRIGKVTRPRMAARQRRRRPRAGPGWAWGKLQTRTHVCCCLNNDDDALVKTKRPRRTYFKWLYRKSSHWNVLEESIKYANPCLKAELNFYCIWQRSSLPNPSQLSGNSFLYLGPTWHQLIGKPRQLILLSRLSLVKAVQPNSSIHGEIIVSFRLVYTQRHILPFAKIKLILSHLITQPVWPDWVI